MRNLSTTYLDELGTKVTRTRGRKDVDVHLPHLECEQSRRVVVHLARKTWRRRGAAIAMPAKNPASRVDRPATSLDVHFLCYSLLISSAVLWRGLSSLSDVLGLADVRELASRLETGHVHDLRDR